MNIIEVKNNLVKVCYEEELPLSGLIQISDIHKSYIAQVLHLESTRVGKFAVAKIIFNFNNGIAAYDGTVPSLRAEVKLFDSANLLNTLNQDNPLILGKLAGQDLNIVVDADMFKDNPIILAEKFYTTKTLIGNLAVQLQARNKKLVVFDTTGIFNYGRFVLTKDFKLPLNESGINYIYEKEFSDATEESKALIQSIFEELSAYSKTVEYIPFDTFKSVVDAEFVKTKLIQLVIMKNRIKQIKDMNVFAQDKSEFGALKEKLESDSIVILDISKVKEPLKQEAIKYVYSVLEKMGSEYYAFTPVSSESADIELLEQIRDTQNVYTTIICDYDYVHIDNLKRNSKNMIMFTPLKQQHDFGGYNIFMQRLAEDEFISYGKMTKFVPLIGKMFQLDPSDIVIPEPEEEPVVQEIVNEEQEEVSEPVQAEEAVLPAEQEVVEEQESSEVIQEEVVQEPVQEEVAEEVVEEAQEVVDDEQPSEVKEPQEDVVQEVKEEPVVEEVKPAVVEEIQAADVETIEKPQIDIEEMAKSSAETVQTPLEKPQQEDVSEVEEALNQVPEMTDDEELSDDDLDMIEELSKPNEEIPVINEEQPVAEQIVEEIQPEEPEVVSEPIQEVVSEPEEEVKEEVVEQEEPVVEPIQPEEPEVVSEVSPEAVQEEMPAPTEEPNQGVPADEESMATTVPQQTEPLQTRAKTTPSVPEYPADIPEEDKVNSDPIQQGDRVFHQEFGEGVVEKMINYGDKVLCSINFPTVGRRLLNPEISEMKKIQ